MKKITKQTSKIKKIISNLINKIKNTQKTYQLLEHTSDIKIEINSKTILSGFKNCTLCFSNIVIDNLKLLKKIKNQQKIQITKHLITKQIIKKTFDYNSLLFELLNEIIFLLDTQEILPIKILKNSTIKKTQNTITLDFKIEFLKINIIKKELNETIGNYLKYQPKSITYNQMTINKNKINYVLDL